MSPHFSFGVHYMFLQHIIIIFHTSKIEAFLFFTFDSHDISIIWRYIILYLCFTPATIWYRILQSCSRNVLNFSVYILIFTFQPIFYLSNKYGIYLGFKISSIQDTEKYLIALLFGYQLLL